MCDVSHMLYDHLKSYCSDTKCSFAPSFYFYFFACMLLLSVVCTNTFWAEWNPVKDTISLGINNLFLILILIYLVSFNFLI